MKIKPVGDKILVKIHKVDEITKSGIILPESAIDSPIQGTIVEVGSGILTHSGTRVPLDVKVGDKVLCRSMLHNGTEIEVDGHPHLLLTEHDLLGIVE